MEEAQNLQQMSQGVQQDVQPSTTPAQTEPTQEPKKEPDLISRVSQFVEENKPSEPTATEGQFNVNDIEKIQDPEAKKYAEDAYKSLQRGFNQKFQELAGLRKELEGKIETDKTWTPERVQSLLNDPSFVQAAQSVAGTTGQQQDQDYSALTDGEKAKLAKIDELEKQLSEYRNNINVGLRTQQDEQLKSKYGNYNSAAVDTLTAELIAKKRNATREDIWKVIDYNPAMERAYKLGRKDERDGISEKVSSASFEGGTAQVSTTGLQKKEGESSEQLWQRIISKNLPAGKRT
jgi:hypothetical protein